MRGAADRLGRRGLACQVRGLELQGLKGLKLWRLAIRGFEVGGLSAESSSEGANAAPQSDGRKDEHGGRVDDLTLAVRGHAKPPAFIGQ